MNNQENAQRMIDELRTKIVKSRTKRSLMTYLLGEFDQGNDIITRDKVDKWGKEQQGREFGAAANWVSEFVTAGFAQPTGKLNSGLYILTDDGIGAAMDIITEDENKITESPLGDPTWGNQYGEYMIRGGRVSGVSHSKPRMGVVDGIIEYFRE